MTAGVGETSVSLRERLREYVRSHPGETVDEIARAVRGRSADVRDVLLAGGFSSSLRAAYPSDRARVYMVASVGGDGPGRAGRPSQCDLIARVLADGLPHSTAEIHQRCGFSRLNSRIAELRSRRGMNIVCEHIPGMGSGPDAYRYRLVGTSESAEEPDTAGTSLPRPSAGSVRGAAALSSADSDAPAEQLSIGAAA